VSTDHFFHAPVLLTEALSFLITSKTGVYVDATLGGGGHAEAIVHQLSGEGNLFALDRDDDAISHATQRLQGRNAILRKGNFRGIRQLLQNAGVERITGALFDLGVSSHQLDDQHRGFSFRGDERLDMRMDRTQALTAFEILNTYPEQHLADIIFQFGEERRSRRIARAICEARSQGLIETTRDLRDVVEEAVGGRFLIKTLARVFQAIRIEVNQELESLREGLGQAIDLLSPGGRIVVIAYHSLEDRIVKNTFQQESATAIPSGNKIVPDQPIDPRIRVLTKKPVEAGRDEVKQNPRARSAKLRAAEKR
jgi:16S rRNA (cytosine1402-N4)-methyltransferase